MKIMRKIIKIDEKLCNGCGQCVPACAEGALEIIDGKARMIAEKYCDGLGACLGDCPAGALTIIEREADDFDEKAVEELLASAQKTERTTASPADHTTCCPSVGLQTFEAITPCQAANQPTMGINPGSALTHWPVKIRLVPPDAPFLKNADLLVAADCASVAYANFHGEFLKDHVVMAGCPKFDDVKSYIDKFTEIFKQGKLRSVSIVLMEVPCCAGLRSIIRKALQHSGADLAITETIISARGEVLRQGQMDL